MIVRISESELYPFYTECDQGGIEVDLPESLVLRLRDIIENFYQVQSEIEKFYEPAEKAVLERFHSFFRK